MNKQIRNLYKLPHVFRCVHDVHRHFKSELSPFYILTEKKCYPDGCVYFHWKCRLLAKHKKCFRGFSHVGQKCANCSYYYEEKQHHYPEIILSGDEQSSFLEEFAEFEEWISELKSKRIPCEGIIANVIPDLSLKRQGKIQRLRANGFLIRFDEGFIDNRFFADPFYLSVSAMTQNELLLRKGDSLEFQAALTIDRGRFKFTSSGRFYFDRRGEERALRKTDVMVALKTYTIQEGQPGKCRQCDSGVLVDLLSAKTGPSRVIVCLQGIADFQYCIESVNTSKSNDQDSCINPGWGRTNCHHVL